MIDNQTVNHSIRTIFPTLRHHFFIIVPILLLFSGSMAFAQNRVELGEGVGITLTDIPGGTFRMGSERGGKDFDEAPVHQVTVNGFRMSTTELTNSQYECYDPSHRGLRGRDGFSSGDSEAVVQVSWYDAIGFCRWLSKKTGRHFRLPTEAEWEYACKAGTETDYWCGDTLLPSMEKNQRTERDKVNISLAVGLSEANPFGLYDMHGNVEEWCMDGYAPYASSPANNPAGKANAEFRVTRGGSHNTDAEYLRSANRSAMIPDDKNCQVGFRIIETEKPVDMQPFLDLTSPVVFHEPESKPFKWKKANGKMFMEPLPYVIPPSYGSVPFYGHNHQSAVTWCNDGSLLAIWYSCEKENGREMAVLYSRFYPGAASWTPAKEFFRVADRNVTGSSLLRMGNGKLLHINGVADSGDWKNLCMTIRESTDDGYTWSETRIIAPGHTTRRQVIAGPIIMSDGRLLQCCDAGPGGSDGTALYISDDGGISWKDTGSTIAGIHAGIVELGDSSLLCLGRSNNVRDDEGREWMPMSISTDSGISWKVSKSVFPPISSGQRLVLKRLDEGPLMVASFDDKGLYISLSYDEGASWTPRLTLTDGKVRTLEGGAWTGSFTMDATHAEPKGYLSCTQTPDGVIHLLSSRLHYRFNLKWLEAQLKKR